MPSDTFSPMPSMSVRGNDYGKIWNLSYERYKQNKKISLQNRNQIQIEEFIREQNGVGIVDLRYSGDGDNIKNKLWKSVGDKVNFAQIHMNSSEGMRVLSWGIIRQNERVAREGLISHRDAGVDIGTESMDCNINTQEYKELNDRLMKEYTCNKKFLNNLVRCGYFNHRVNGKKMYKLVE